MSENKVIVVVPKDYNGTPIEVVLREGTVPEQLDEDIYRTSRIEITHAGSCSGVH